MNYTKKTLRNGLRIIAAPMKDSTTVTVLVMVEAGSKYETKELSGLSHFLEHMCFKGTAKRPSAFAITRELDSIGAEYNAFTGHEYTGYFAKAHPKHFKKILDVVSDMYLNPVFDDAEIEKEKGVIIEEMNMVKDSPAKLVRDRFRALVYGDQPAGWPILGTKETVGAMRREDFLEYRRRHYVAKGTYVVIAGNFDAKKAVAEVARAFEGIPEGKKETKRKVSESQSAPQILLTRKDSDQTHLVLGVRAYPASDKRTYALSVLESAIAGGMSSMLWQKIRIELGVAYYVYGYSDASTDHGLFLVGAGVDNSRVVEATSSIMDVLRSVRDRELDPDELKRAKDYYLGRMYLDLETSESIAEFYADQELLERELRRPSEIARRIKEVTTKDVRAVARDIFKDSKLNFALIGRHDDEAPLRKVLSF